jgi:hypothetical protein
MLAMGGRPAAGSGQIGAQLERENQGTVASSTPAQRARKSCLV